MFESNFPVDKGSYSYPVFWNASKILAKGASASEKRDLFRPLQRGSTGWIFSPPSRLHSKDRLGPTGAFSFSHA